MLLFIQKKPKQINKKTKKKTTNKPPPPKLEIGFFSVVGKMKYFNKRLPGSE